MPRTFPRNARYLVLLTVALLFACTGTQQADLPTPIQDMRHGVEQLTGLKPGIGGLSGLEVTADGRNFIALSDRGFLVYGRLERRDGQLVAAEVEDKEAIKGPVQSADLDSEGLAIGPDGRMAISLEGDKGLMREDRNGHMQFIPSPPDMETLPENRQYEALAIDPEGRLVTFPESGWRAGSFPLWRLEKDGWHKVMTLPMEHGFHPVGADFGPDGTLFLLERAFFGGLENRILQLDPDHPDRPATVIWTSGGPSRTNFEGLSAWENAEGQTVLTLIADNNFGVLLHQRMLEITLAAPETGE